MRPADEHYINAIRNNDRKGLQQLYQEFLPRISAFIRKNRGEERGCQGCFSGCPHRNLQKSTGGRFSANERVLHPAVRDLPQPLVQPPPKKVGKRVSIPEDYKYTGEADLSQLREQQEEQQLFWDAFRQLGQDCQQLLQWSFAKVKMAEIAERMEYSSVGYAKKRKFQCKEQLIQRVKADARYSELMNK